MIELIDDELLFRFPEVHEDAELWIEFQRTLRIPDDNREYPLPPGLGQFPLLHVDDYADQAPEGPGASTAASSFLCTRRKRCGSISMPRTPWR